MFPKPRSIAVDMVDLVRALYPMEETFPKINMDRMQQYSIIFKRGKNHLKIISIVIEINN